MKMNSSISLSDHIVVLAKELLDDIELSRLTAEALLLKATRLARLTGSDEEREWLSYEMFAYRNDTKVARKYLALTGRWIDEKSGTAYWGPLAQQEAEIQARQVHLKNARDFFVADPWIVG